MKLTHILYADASDVIGFGHVSRMYSLAETLALRGLPFAFATNSWAYIEQRLAEWPCPVIDGWTSARMPDVFVADTPDFAVLQGVPSPTTNRIIVFDDFGELAASGITVATHVVTPHLLATVAPAGVPVFRGPQWLPLRRAVTDAASMVGPRDMGSLMNEPIIRVLIHPRDAATVGAVVESFGMQAVPLAGWRGAIDLARSCHVAAVPVGVMAYEAMALGLPVFVHAPTARHDPLRLRLVADGHAIDMADLTADIRTRAMLARLEAVRTRGRLLVDGRGADRLARYL